MSDLLDLDQRITLFFNGSDNLFWDNVMMTVTDTWSWTLVVITLFVVIFRNNDLREFFAVLLMLALMIAVADRICSGLVKPMVARWRPTQDPQIMYLVDVVNGYRGGRFGFFSGHSCNTFCVATFLSLLYRYRSVTITLFCWAATTTFTRLYLGVHYFGDVLVGFFVGLFIGAVFYILFEHIQFRLGAPHCTSDQYTRTGYRKSDMNSLLSVVFFNYILVVIVSIFRGI